jgi:hypothetical protein
LFIVTCSVNKNKRRLPCVGVIVLGLGAAVTVCMLVGLPFDARPLGAKPVRIAKHVWLNLDSDIHDIRDWNWKLTITPSDVGARAWDGLVSGTVIASDVKQYCVPRPTLIVIRYATTSGSSRWMRILIESNPFGYDEKELESEGALREDLLRLGVRESLQMNDVPVTSKVTVGAVSGAMIVVCLVISVAAGMLLCRRGSGDRSHPRGTLGSGKGDIQALSHSPDSQGF